MPGPVDRADCRSSALLGFLACVLFLIWVEVGPLADDPPVRPVPATSWSSLGIHAGARAWASASGFAHAAATASCRPSTPEPDDRPGATASIYGARLERDVHGLRRLAPRGPGRSCGELFAVRGRRLYSIARLSIIEANRPDVGPLGGHHRLRRGPGVHPLVPPAAPAPPRWAGSSSAR